MSWRLNKKGMSLLEGLIASTLMTIFAYFALRQFGMIRSSQSDLGHRLRMRQLMEMEYSKVKGASARFPRIQKGGATNILTYAKCFDRTFSAVTSSGGQTDYVVVDMAEPQKRTRGFCGGTSEFEVHITPSADDLFTADIYVFFVPEDPDNPKYHYHVNVRFEPGL